MERKQFSKILKTLKKNFEVPSWGRITSFELLIRTVLSQHTNEKNTGKAFSALKSRFRISPEELAKAELKEIINCVKPAGLYKQKAKRVKEISKRLLHKRLEKILKLKNAREKLLELPGVGDKTADVVLNFTGRTTMPIDTHISRISKRLGIAKEDAGYTEIKNNLEELIPKKEISSAHILLILFGRKICRARNPKCRICMIYSYCPWKEKTIYLNS